jgi:L-lactate dehydrogenase complex protein LldG
MSHQNTSRDKILHALRRVAPAPGSSSNRPAGSTDQPVDSNSASGTHIARFCQGMQANHAEIIPCHGADWTDSLRLLAERKMLRKWLLGTGHPLIEHAHQALADCAEAIPFTQPFEHLKARIFDVDAGFTLAAGAMADPAALLLCPDRNEPRTLSLIPPVHVVLLDAGRIVATLDQLSNSGLPTQTGTANRLLISGPSKTADIQQTLAYGAHGPRELIILLKLGDAET